MIGSSHANDTTFKIDENAWEEALETRARERERVREIVRDIIYIYIYEPHIYICLTLLTPGPGFHPFVVNSQSIVDVDSRSTSYSHYETRGFRETCCVPGRGGNSIFSSYEPKPKSFPGPRQKCGVFDG